MENASYGQKYANNILKSTSKVYNILLGRYNCSSFRTFGKPRYIDTNRENIANQSDGAGILGSDKRIVRNSLIGILKRKQ